MFDEILVSDYRASFLDLDVQGLFDRKLPLLMSPSLCHIRGDHPSNITKYLKFLVKYIDDHNLVSKATMLLHHHNYTPEAADHLDQTFTDVMLVAFTKS